MYIKNAEFYPDFKIIEKLQRSREKSKMTQLLHTVIAMTFIYLFIFTFLSTIFL